jgi:hypothetical protein
LWQVDLFCALQQAICRLPPAPKKSALGGAEYATG